MSTIVDGLLSFIPNLSWQLWVLTLTGLTITFAAFVGSALPTATAPTLNLSKSC